MDRILSEAKNLEQSDIAAKRCYILFDTLGTLDQREFVHRSGRNYKLYSTAFQVS
jgi:hypothetical protein